MMKTSVLCSGDFVEKVMEMENGSQPFEESAEFIQSLLEQDANLIYRRVEGGGFLLGTNGADGIPNTRDDFFSYWPCAEETD